MLRTNAEKRLFALAYFVLPHIVTDISRQNTCSRHPHNEHHLLVELFRKILYNSRMTDSVRFLFICIRHCGCCFVAYEEECRCKIGTTREEMKTERCNKKEKRRKEGIEWKKSETERMREKRILFLIYHAENRYQPITPHKYAIINVLSFRKFFLLSQLLMPYPWQ